MRLPLIAQADLSPEQYPIYEDMRAGIDEKLPGFKVYWRGWRADRTVESVADEPEVWKADLGVHQGALGLAGPAEASSRGGDPGHRREISFGL